MSPRTVPGRSTALLPREKTHATCADHQSFALVPTPDDKHLVVQLQLVVALEVDTVADCYFPAQGVQARVSPGGKVREVQRER